MAWTMSARIIINLPDGLTDDEGQNISDEFSERLYQYSQQLQSQLRERYYPNLSVDVQL